MTWGRLVKATTPEAGSVCNGEWSGSNCINGYDSEGKLVKVTDTRNITTTLNYDALHRVTGKSYNDTPATPAVTFTYDTTPSFSPAVANGIGRLTGAEITLSGTCARTSFSYDQIGRVLDQWDWNPLTGCGSSFHQVYTFNKAGQLLTHNVNGAFTLTHTYDAAGQPSTLTSSLSDAQHPGTLATMNSIGAAGPAKMTYGNNLTTTWAYNNRMQVCRIEVNSAGTMLTACGDATPSGNVLDLKYGYDQDAGTPVINNGNVVSWDAVGSTLNFSRTYDYDHVNRLRQMSSSQETIQWGYDVWGNRTTQEIVGVNTQTWGYAASNRNNDSGYTFDAAGNMTQQPGPTTFQWDAENRLRSINGSSNAPAYLYDAFGRRMRKKTGSDSIPAYVYYFYDAAGNVIVEKDGSGATLAEYLRFDGQLIGQYKSTTTYFFHQDHLGSTRIVTNVSGGTADTYDNRPFGDNVSGGSLTSLKFTGLEKDSATGEAGLNHTWFRKHSAEIGRWLSADPMDGSISNPQTWNRYGYVLNDPVNFIDPLGLTECYLDGMRTACSSIFGRPGGVGGAYNWCPSEGACRNLSFFADGRIEYTSVRLDTTVCAGIGGSLDCTDYYVRETNTIDFLAGASNFFAGAGDVLSWGITRMIRERQPGGDVVDTCSAAYSVGEWTGIAVSTATGAAGGVKAAGTKAVGKEFSHWIPKRMGGPRSILNGNYVSPQFHYLTDPFRYPSGYQAWGAKLSPVLQQAGRVPFVYTGTAAGGAYGTVGAAVSGCRGGKCPS